MAKTTRRMRKAPAKRLKNPKPTSNADLTISHKNNSTELATGEITQPAELYQRSARRAAQQVFGVAELLEEILTSLPMKDLLLDQRRALFLLPVDDGGEKADKEDVLVYMGDLWLEYLAGPFGLEQTALKQILQHTYLNPLLESHFDIAAIAQEVVSGKPKHSQSRSGRCKEASWRRMLAFQPPLERLKGVPKGISKRTDTEFWKCTHQNSKHQPELLLEALQAALNNTKEYECAKDLEEI